MLMLWWFCCFRMVKYQCKINFRPAMCVPTLICTKMWKWSAPGRRMAFGPSTFHVLSSPAINNRMWIYANANISCSSILPTH